MRLSVGQLDSYYEEHRRLLRLGRADFEKERGELLQNQRAHAASSVPFYQRADVPRDANALTPYEALSGFPLIDRRMVQSAPDEFVSTVDCGEPTVGRSTSGTTGRPIVIHKPKSLFDFYAAVALDKMVRLHGWTPFDVYFMLHGGGIGNIRPEVSVPELVDLIEEARPDILYCYPSHLMKVIDLVERKRLHEWNLKYLETHSEHSTVAERQAMREAFACDVYDDYGATEVGPIASECKRLRRHIVEHCVYVEVIGPNGHVLRDGAVGEIVVTDLRNRHMPLIRYRTGDLGAIDRQHDCDCAWSVLPVLTKLWGRVEDNFLLPSGDVVPSGQLIGPIHVRKPTAIVAWQLTQLRTDLAELTLVRGQDFDVEEVRAMVSDIARVLGGEVEIRVTVLTQAPHSMGRKGVFRSHLDFGSMDPGREAR